MIDFYFHKSKMESLCSKQVNYTTTHQLSVSFLSKTEKKEPVKNPIHTTKKRFQLLQAIQSKKSDFQDFRDYAKPLQLLPATKVSVCSETSQGVSSLFNLVGSESLFKLKLQTSNFYPSSLTNPNAGILLCIIDQKGNSILQRILACSTINYSPEFDHTDQVDVLHFQRGSVDEFTFKGPKVEGIKAIWIGLESGQWRFKGMSLTVIGVHHQPSPESQSEYFGYQYDFDADDVLLGDGTNMSMVELRPILVTKLSESSDPFTFLSNRCPQSVQSFNSAISNAESMKQYADLKFSLLLYDAILVFVGTLVISVTVGGSSGFAFLIGGITGFLYLLIVQRSVDELPGPESIFQKAPASFDQTLRSKGPIASLALGFVVSLVVAAKYRSWDESLVLTSKDVLVGMLGFLACKVAVFLAAFKPIPPGLNSEEDQITK